MKLLSVKLEDELHKGFSLKHYGFQQMYGFDLLLSGSASQFERLLDSLLRLDSETVEIHICGLNLFLFLLSNFKTNSVPNG